MNYETAFANHAHVPFLLQFHFLKILKINNSVRSRFFTVISERIQVLVAIIVQLFDSGMCFERKREILKQMFYKNWLSNHGIHTKCTKY